MRARNIKPTFFSNEDLADLEYQARLLFIGLWCAADREGRLEDRPKRLKALLFPYDEDMTATRMDGLLSQLEDAKFIIRYQVGEGRFIQVVNWKKHQRPYQDERASTLPPPMDYHEDPKVPTRDHEGTHKAPSRKQQGHNKEAAGEQGGAEPTPPSLPPGAASSLPVTDSLNPVSSNPETESKESKPTRTETGGVLGFKTMAGITKGLDRMEATRVVAGYVMSKPWMHSPGNPNGLTIAQVDGIAEYLTMEGAQAAWAEFETAAEDGLRKPGAFAIKCLENHLDPDDARDYRANVRSNRRSYQERHA